MQMQTGKRDEHPYGITVQATSKCTREDMVQRIRDFHVAMVQARELPQKWAEFFAKIYGTNENSIAYEWQPNTLPAWMEIFFWPPRNQPTA
jgi:hypothetical protein